MAKRTDIKKVLVIGSGPIVIGQAAEFDYAGTQACIALKEEGYQVILANSNPATIMTDTSMADKVYMEPLTLEYMARLLRYERPDAILPGIGGQTGLNLAMQLYRKGVLDECQVELLGTNADSIDKAEDREKFKELCMEMGEPVLPSQITYSMEEAVKAAEEIGYPVVLRPAFTLGGTGGGFAKNRTELEEIMKNALRLSPVNQVLVEKSVYGYKEIEYEVMRDGTDRALVICNMENVDPMGVHTGDSTVVAPCQTLSKEDEQMLADSAIRIIRALKIKGGCNVQFALDPNSSTYYLIEVNPRVSRSSALASKASGYPIARVTAKIAVGMNLDEIVITDRTADMNPSLKYIVTKMARFPFDKFAGANHHLGTQMKATGEVMSIGGTLEESILKAVRSLEIGTCHLWMDKFESWSKEELLAYAADPTDDRIFAIAQLLRLKTDTAAVYQATCIDPFFLEKLRCIIDYEEVLASHKGDAEVLRRAKEMGISDQFIARLWGVKEIEVYRLRETLSLFPVYRMIDTCAKDEHSYIPYFYSDYHGTNQSRISDRKKIVVLGAGPIRIGQGVEFDYSTVHAVQTIKQAGYEAIIINNNPETVSTDYTTSDKLYFEPLTAEDVMNILYREQPEGVVASLGGQTAINLARPLAERGVKMIGTDVQAIDRAENRDAFEKVMEELGIPQPEGVAVTNIEDGVRAAAKIGYPVLVRPSYVLGGRAMQIVADEKSLREYLKNAVAINEEEPVLVDKYIAGKELEVDAVCDGADVFVAGIMEHVERTGVHSGDSISVYPTFSVSGKAKGIILEYTKKLGLGIGIRGLFNIQFIVAPGDRVYVIEVNPRSSRTVPFLSKATGVPLADVGTLAMLGRTLKEQGIFTICPDERRDRWYVKVPAFSFSKLSGMDTYLSPEMKSTGEVIGYDRTLTRALYKALQAAGTRVVNYGTVLAMLADEDKEEGLPLIRRFYRLGFNIEATRGTATFLREHGIRTRIKRKLSEGSTELLDSIRKGYITYVINTRGLGTEHSVSDGQAIRQCAVENNVVMFTSLDTVRVLLDVLEETTLQISTIDE
ncbi:MAG: carbamoyl-phosphate synthase large subunit [Clostridiaceae bacterium]|nr:carbamoyl-phosphate synthase large subunit [Clostridiaceae bacterium]